MKQTRQVVGAVGGRVEILRDGSGIPHVYAASTQDLYFGLGVAMAEDRLWQMDRLRRRALGRQAEILGPAYLASDIAHLTVGIDRIAAGEADAMDDATRGVVASLVAEINRQIELMGRDLPLEFGQLGYEPEPFTVRDVVAIARGIWWSLNGRIDRIVAAEAARLLPEQFRGLYLTPEASENRVLQHAAGTDDATGSNNWALHGSRTTGGKPVLCGDPHQPFWVPSSWYEYALHGPEDDVAGAGHPGFPGLWWGSNGRIAWAITNNMASTRDLYVEEVDPADPHRYRDGDAWRTFEERRLDIKVRGAAAQALTIRSTARGPVVNALVPSLDAAGDPPLSLRWVGMEHMDDIRASIAVGRARDWTGFRAALRDWSVAIFNFVYADAGDISATRWRGASRSVVAWCRASAMPTTPPIAGGAPFRSTTCRICSTRPAATSPAPTSASCRTTGSSRSTAPTRRGIAACDSTRRWGTARWTRRPTSRCRTM